MLLLNHFLNDVIKICLLPVSLLQEFVYRKHGSIEELVVNKCALAQKSYLKQERQTKIRVNHLHMKQM